MRRSWEMSDIVGKQWAVWAANQRVRGSSPWRRTSIEAQADIAICSWAFVRPAGDFPHAAPASPLPPAPSRRSSVAARAQGGPGPSNPPPTPAPPNATRARSQEDLRADSSVASSHPPQAVLLHRGFAAKVIRESGTQRQETPLSPASHRPSQGRGTLTMFSFCGWGSGGGGTAMS
jgi:hypothetical protein